MGRVLSHLDAGDAAQPPAPGHQPVGPASPSQTHPIARWRSCDAPPSRFTDEQTEAPQGSVGGATELLVTKIPT